MDTPVDRILFLQRTVGNQAVSRLMKSGALQAKLRIGQPGDVYEQEADRVADAVMRMPEPGVQRQVEPEEEEEETLQSKPLVNQITPLVQVQRQEEPEEEEEMLQVKPLAGQITPLVQIQSNPLEEEEETIQAKPLADQITPLVQRQPDPLEEEKELIQTKSNTGMAPQVTPGIAQDIDSLKGAGQPLPTSERAFFDPRFGRDFSNVRVHIDNRAARTAQTINARAFTLGRNVVFGEGQYMPERHEGRRLIAHELTHVVQQGGVRSSPQRKLQPRGMYEREADKGARIIVAGDKINVKNKDLTLSTISSFQLDSCSSNWLQREPGGNKPRDSNQKKTRTVKSQTVRTIYFPNQGSHGKIVLFSERSLNVSSKKLGLTSLTKTTTYIKGDMCPIANIVYIIKGFIGFKGNVKLGNKTKSTDIRFPFFGWAAIQECVGSCQAGENLFSFEVAYGIRIRKGNKFREVFTTLSEYGGNLSITEPEFPPGLLIAVTSLYKRTLKGMAPAIQNLIKSYAAALAYSVQDTELRKYKCDPKTFKPIPVRREKDPAIDILNRSRYNSSKYARAISRWSNSRPIWPRLTSRNAKENFIRYIVNFDMTNCRPYVAGSPRGSSSCATFARARLAFTNLCQGFATQMYVRYYDAPRRLGRGDIRRLRTIAHVYENRTAAKFRIPIFIATVPGHAFNAILIERDATNINSYLFLEPQFDTIFDAKSPTFQKFFRVGILGLSRLTSYSKRGKYHQTNVANFIRDRTGTATYQRLTLSQRVWLSGVMGDLFIAGNWRAWKITVARQPSLSYSSYIRQIQTDSDYVRRIIARYEAYIGGRARKFSDKKLAFIGRFVIGRQFTKYPFGPTETLTKDKFIRLMNKPALRLLIP
ncbi:MAG: hypothetical protein BBJ57_03895 [Desulfobacterales bacterium PC51MH44]|nr:MAG: hypothetical protein BBJ57_03895 [Desulfobacterales bacterium PC51MH44]